LHFDLVNRSRFDFNGLTETIPMSTPGISEAVPETSPQSLRTEIIESQKSQADYLKWKLISVGAIGTITLASNGDGNRLLACLVPLLCAYVDLISFHLMIRIIAIGAYLRERGDRYEIYTFTLREKSGQNPYIFEVTALHGSSLAFDVIILVTGFVSIFTKHPLSYPVSITFIFCGLAGVFWTGFLFILFSSRQREILRLAKEILTPASDAK
jgi:hypothetical protein